MKIRTVVNTDSEKFDDEVNALLEQGWSADPYSYHISQVTASTIQVAEFSQRMIFTETKDEAESQQAELLYHCARHIRNWQANEIPMNLWNHIASELLLKIRALDPSRYEQEMKKRTE